jgi:hypothetical protein
MLEKIQGYVVRILALLMFVISGIYVYQGKLDGAVGRMVLAVVLSSWADVRWPGPGKTRE